jgi:hypothetical protein
MLIYVCVCVCVCVLFEQLNDNMCVVVVVVVFNGQLLVFYISFQVTPLQYCSDLCHTSYELRVLYPPSLTHSQNDLRKQITTLVNTQFLQPPASPLQPTF